MNNLSLKRFSSTAKFLFVPTKKKYPKLELPPHFYCQLKKNGCWGIVYLSSVDSVSLNFGSLASNMNEHKRFTIEISRYRWLFESINFYEIDKNITMIDNNQEFPSFHCLYFKILHAFRVCKKFSFQKYHQKNVVSSKDSMEFEEFQMKITERQKKWG